MFVIVAFLFDFEHIQHNFRQTSIFPLFLFLFSEFSFTYTHDPGTAVERKDHLYSSLPLPLAHEHSGIYLQVCNWNVLVLLIVAHVFIWLLLNETEPPLGTSILIEC